MVKVSDIIAEFLRANKIKVVFGIIGSANAHIFDSVQRLGYTRIVNMFHEQGAVMAMGAHYRATGKLAAALVTAGAGSSNAITGILSNWADSIPGIIIAGQESTNYLVDHKNLRMMGTQGFDSTKMVKDITKYSVTITDANKLIEKLNSAISATMKPRMGPAWINVPFNIQSQLIESNLEYFEQPTYTLNDINTEEINNIINNINNSKKPVFIFGNGIRHQIDRTFLIDFIETFNIPILLTWAVIDMLPESHYLNYGRFGLYGQRRGNFVVQNSDLLIIFGSRLSIPQIGYNTKDFAPNSKIILIDIDTDEVSKLSSIIDKHINADCVSAMPKIKTYLVKEKIEILEKSKWLQQCNYWKIKYPINQERDYHSEIEQQFINSYVFLDKLSSILQDNHVIVTDMGTALLSGHQALKLKSNQSLFTSLGLGEMGYGLPGAIGAAVACPDRPILCLNCDGGMMFNLQELQTIINYELPIKIIVFNNDGYLMIKHTQKLILEGRYTTVNKSTGIGLPNYCKLGNALGYKTMAIKTWDDYDKNIDYFLNCDGPAICEVFMNPEQEFIPKVKGIVGSDRKIHPTTLDNMSPLIEE